MKIGQDIYFLSDQSVYSCGFCWNYIIPQKQYSSTDEAEGRMASLMRDHEKIKNRDNGTRMNPTDIADTYYFVHQQPQSAWVHELDLRANMEKF